MKWNLNRLFIWTYYHFDGWKQANDDDRCQAAQAEKWIVAVWQHRNPAVAQCQW